MQRHWTRERVAGMVVHTLLKHEAGEVDVRFLVEEATDLGASAVCVSPSMVPAMLDAGATRLGRSGTRAVLDGLGAAES
ncbi:MAG: deoxyribose-phosphate aldolase [Mycobacterium sp.]|jgi:deoxyribose-phosphate aldolase|nr:deoxyribose-phosphate aldolase [Mycobacterium sp.]